jgi:hypothetical protein
LVYRGNVARDHQRACGDTVDLIELGLSSRGF